LRRLYEKEETTMELKDLKKENLKEAEKQYKEEKKNAEIEFAKTELRNIMDKLNELDRQIKSLEEQKKQYLDKAKIFG
jgi:3-methyladenine DNA glycosylase/8-oxoguanine DNA glycosylase